MSKAKPIDAVSGIIFNEEGKRWVLPKELVGVKRLSSTIDVSFLLEGE